TLVIDDGNEETPTVSVSLVGTGINLPSQPSIEVGPQSKDIPTDFTPCFVGGTCMQIFPDTFYKETATLQIKVRNLGCPALKITSMELQPVAGSGALAFFLDQPAVPPTAATPMILSTADGNAETVLSLRFAPENDGSGITQRFATLTLKTNDPANPTFDVTLYGSAADPSVYATPTFCDFSNLTDTCGYPTRQANMGHFEVKNGGGVDITIDSTTFQKGGQSRFAITAPGIQGQTIAPGASKFIDVTHTDRPLYATDLLVVTAKAGTQSAGSAFISVAGGNKPCLTTDPLDQLNFQDPASELTTQQIQVKNGPPPCGDLVINKAFVDPSPFFSIVAPLVPAGEVVPANNARIVTVQYKKPVSGGTQTGVLRVDTNDPDYGPPPYKVVLLYSNSPLDELPTAVLKGFLPTDTTFTNPFSGSMNVRLSTLPTGQKHLILSGKDSFDPGNTSATPISNWRFRLARKPANATNALLENDGVKGTQNTAKLTLDPAATGIYTVTLLVWDDKNQQAALASELTIAVAQ
ncbi:MAG: hypothetical protein ACYC8T_28690, partial [Myxococcaceae bacterium]